MKVHKGQRGVYNGNVYQVISTEDESLIVKRVGSQYPLTIPANQFKLITEEGKDTNPNRGSKAIFG